MGKMKAMKAMKGMKAMKAAMGMKAMKKKKTVSVIAKGKTGKASVFAGRKQKTIGGLTKDKLMRSKSGKIVSKASSAAGKKNWVKNGLKAWADAGKAARKDLKCKGFVAIGGKTPAGKALHAKAKALLK